MIRIVGHNSNIFVKTTCLKCASILEYTPGEVCSRRVGSGSRGAVMEYFIFCPNCKFEVKVGDPLE